MTKRQPASPETRTARRIALLCALGVALMIGVSYAAVPLYRMFCQATGFGGTPQRADAAPERVLGRKVTIRFDSAIASGLPWKFYPEQRAVEVRVGDVGLAYYKAVNESDRPVTGRAVYNVTPDKAGAYFVKIECFCFQEQTLEPGQSVDMPVQFYIDPEIAQNRNLDEVRTVTLSYTFFNAAPERPNRVSRTDADPKDSGTGG